MSKLPFILIAIVLGGMLTFQPGLNADVARRISSPLGAGVVSIFVSVVIAAVVLLLSRQQVQWAPAAAMPWHLWLAGVIGAVFVIGALWVAPILGASVLFAAVVAGQMIGATVADQVGIGGYQAHAFDPWRIVAIALVLAGVWLFQRAA